MSKGDMQSEKQTVNSENYWDKRFKEDWDEKSGDDQSKFFINLAFEMFPKWLNDLLRNGDLSIMDWGCAEGDGTAVFAKKFAKNSFTGIDFAESAIKNAKERYKQDNLKYDSIDLLTTNYDKKYDIVFTSNVLEHFHNPWKVFEKISNYSKDVFVMMVPFNEDPKNLHFEHFHSFSAKEFPLERGEFKIVHFEVRNTKRIENTCWAGQQALVVFLRKDSKLIDTINFANTKLSADTSVDINDSITHSEMRTKYNELLNENDNYDLRKKQLDEAKKLLQSRRYVLTNELIDRLDIPISLVRQIRNKMARRRVDSPQTTILSGDEELIYESGYFDAEFYLRNNPDIEAAGVDPLWHFVNYGGKEFRNPSLRFDSAYFAYKNNLDTDAIDINPLIQFLNNTGNNLDSSDYSVAERKKYEKKYIDSIVDRSRHHTNLVLIESMSWFATMKQRPHHIARLLAKKNVCVIYVSKGVGIPREVEDNLFLIDAHDEEKITKRFKSKNLYYWLFSTTPTKRSQIDSLKSQNYKVIYDYIDDIDESISGDISRQLENFDDIKVINPAIAIASARNLKKQLQTKLPDKKVLLCQNAVDIDDFNLDRITKQHTIPGDMVDIIGIKKPIVGFYGAIAPWLDYHLINTLAQKRKDLNFVFIGVDYNDSLKKLNITENVHFLGPKNYKDLPDYSYLFDCAIIPFNEGDIAKSTSPVKLFEYMAMGLPTICTKDLNECAGFDYIYLSKDSSEFETNIDKAIKAKKTKKAQTILIKQAKDNSWQSRVDDVYNAIKEIETKALR